jgi:hypothetical protein
LAVLPLADPVFADAEAINRVAADMFDHGLNTAKLASASSNTLLAPYTSTQPKPWFRAA